MDLNFVRPSQVLRKTRSIAVGDLIRLPDNTPTRKVPKGARTAGATSEPETKKHVRVVVHLKGAHAFLVPIVTDKSNGARACILEPSDMPDGVLGHRSFLSFGHTATRVLSALQAEVDSGKARRFDPCPPATLRRILSVLASPMADLDGEMRLRLGISTPVLPDLRS